MTFDVLCDILYTPYKFQKTLNVLTWANSLIVESTTRGSFLNGN